MTIYTYMDDNELERDTTNKELNKILAKVRDTIKIDARVTERFSHVTKKWWQFFKENETKPLYTLYVRAIDDYPYWQVINFYRDHSSTSINTDISAEIMIAYLYGMLAGIYSKEFDSKKDKDA